VSEPTPSLSPSTSGGTAARVFRGLAELHAAEGTSLGVSAWLRIEQDRIDAFAAATEDFQWIHVDAERARTGPGGRRGAARVCRGDGRAADALRLSPRFSRHW
jgi:acyl dehydratase